MQYPLHEKIGQPDLLVGREEEFRNFHKWIDNIPRMISKSRVILARRKSGKTSFVQRLFNELCMADPFFISCVIQSNYAQRDLTTTSGVIDTVDYEISDRNSEMSKTWAEYIGLTLQRVNDQYAKQILLHLSKHADRCWTPQELKDELHIEQDIYTIQDKLITMAESDMINRGRADIDFCGLQDGTLNLVLQYLGQFLSKERFLR